MKRYQVASLGVLLWALVQSVGSAQDQGDRTGQAKLDIEYVRLHDRAVKFIEEFERYQLAGILWGKILGSTAPELLTDPPDGKWEQLQVRNKLLQPLANTAKRMMAKCPSGQLEEVRMAYDRWASDELKGLKLGSSQLKKLRDANPDGYGLLYPLACHYIRSGEFEKGYGWMYLLTHINPYPKLPEKEVMAWLDAAQRGIRDPGQGKQAVQKLSRSPSGN